MSQEAIKLTKIPKAIQSTMPFHLRLKIAAIFEKSMDIFLKITAIYSE